METLGSRAGKTIAGPDSQGQLREPSRRQCHGGRLGGNSIPHRAGEDQVQCAEVKERARQKHPGPRVAAAVRAIVRAQGLLRENPARATEVGRRRFPAAAAEIIAAVVERDLPFYDPAIGEKAVAVMNGFARSIGLLTAPVAYEDTVAARFRNLWVGSGDRR